VSEVDDLAELRARLKDLREREAELREKVIRSNSRRGEKWYAEVQTQSSESVDIKSLRAALGKKVAPYLRPSVRTVVRLHPLDQTNEWDDDWRRKRRERPIPVHVRQAAIWRSEGVCETCFGSPGAQVHHKTYRCQTSPDGLIFGYEQPEDLLVLCGTCHYHMHHDIEGNYYLDPEELDATRT
jgi:hypothetical protein